ncbi:MAG: GTPase Era [Actinomycetota bacterium]|nr:GTPase Era [Actinomycetota bacterium]
MATEDDEQQPEVMQRSGFACFVGRPNTGKSTLLNAMIGSKIAITSDKPQTTRKAIRGILTRTEEPAGQLVIIDTPGLHKPRTLLGERLGDVVRSTFSQVDVIGLCVPADERIGPGDRRIAGELATLAPRTPVIGIVTKSDKVNGQRVAEQLLALSQLREFDQLIPVSATNGFQVDEVGCLLMRQLPAGPPLYVDGEITDEPLESMISELVREAALEGVRDELPHSLAAAVDEILPREGRTDLTDVFVTLYVERDSQKPIVLGPKGSRLAGIGRRARAGIEPLVGTRVYLNVHVAVAKDWQRDPKQLRKLGFDR